MTSTTHSGNLGGLSGADAICATRAAAGGLTGTFQAWISDGVDSPSSRVAKFGTRYVTTGGQVIASNWEDLTDGSINAGGIQLDETGSDVGAGKFVWANVLQLAGIPAGPNHCAGWTSDSGTGQTGLTGAAASTWTNTASTSDCSTTLHLYCIRE